MRQRSFGLVGWSGSGKTTLLTQLLPKLIEYGLTVSTMKHTHHAFDIDKPGKDSHNHRMAGAMEVMVTSSNRWALMHELRGEPEPDVETMLAKMSPVDLVLIEGFKSHRHAKMEVYRPSLGKPLLAATDDTVVAVATNEPLEAMHVPILDLDNVDEVARFILDFVGFENAKRHGAA
ncbi:MAG: molybdopterin-guanine dinucleotide biosynthesis protein B [Rhodospirillales bacterium]